MSNLIDNANSTVTWTDIVSKLKKSIAKDTHVASLGEVQSITTAYSSGAKYGIMNVKLFPTISDEDSTIASGYFFSDKDYQSGDWVLCIFTDKDFRTNVKRNSTDVVDTSDIYHSMSYCIIIPLKDYK